MHVISRIFSTLKPPTNQMLFCFDWTCKNTAACKLHLRITGHRIIRIMIKTSFIKDDDDEVIGDLPTQCVVHRSVFMLWVSNPQLEEVNFPPHNIDLIWPAALWKIPAYYFQHGKWNVKIPIVKTEERERERERVKRRERRREGQYSVLLKLSCCHLVVEGFKELLCDSSLGFEKLLTVFQAAIVEISDIRFGPWLEF